MFSLGGSLSLGRCPHLPNQRARFHLVTPFLGTENSDFFFLLLICYQDVLLIIIIITNIHCPVSKLFIPINSIHSCNDLVRWNYCYPQITEEDTEAYRTVAKTAPCSQHPLFSLFQSKRNPILLGNMAVQNFPASFVGKCGHGTLVWAKDMGARVPQWFWNTLSKRSLLLHPFFYSGIWNLKAAILNYDVGVPWMEVHLAGRIPLTTITRPS